MTTPRRGSLFAVACLGMLAFGIVLTTLGATLPEVIATFGIDKAQAGALFLLMTFGILAGSLVFGPIVDRRGYKGMLVFALAAVVLGLEAIAFANTMAMLRLGIVLIGFGGGIVNGGVNALVADISEGARGAAISLVGVFFGIGAAGMPFALAMLSDTFAQSTLLAAIGGFVVLPLALAAVTAFPAPKQAQGFPIAQAGGLLREGVLLLMGVMLFLQSGMEITVGGWTSTFFIEELDVPADRALGYLSLYWFGMTLARIVLGSVLRTMSGTRVLFACIAVAFTGALLLVSTRSVPAAGLGVFLLGAGFAATFPVVLGFVGDRYARLSGTAFSIVIVMALTGGMLLPWATGVFGNVYGLRGSFLVVPAALVLLSILLTIVSRRLAARAPAG